MKIEKETIIRTILFAFALINQILCLFGKSPIPVSDELLTQCISTVFTVVISIWAWWKNNSFTKEAILADRYLDALRYGFEDEEDE